MPASTPSKPDAGGRAAAPLRQRAVRAVTWSVVKTAGRQLSGFVIFVALARLLPPEAFGLVAWAGVVVGLLQILANAGLEQSLVQREEVEAGHLDAAFWANLGLAVVLSAAVLAAAPGVAGLLGEPELAPVLRGLALVMPLVAVIVVPQALLRRELRFRTFALRMLVGNTVGGLAGVAAALGGLGLWALVVQQVCSAAVVAVALLSAVPWRPGLRGSVAHLRDLLGFGAGMAGGSLLRFVSMRADQFVIGSLLGPETLGIYVIGMRAVRFAVDLASRTLNSVSLPVLSQLQSDAPRMARAIRTTGQANGFVSMPAFLGLLVVAPDFLPAVFGAQWLPSVPVLQVLCVYALLWAIRVVSGPVVNAMGKSGWTFAMAAFEAPLSVLLIWIAAPHGPVAVAVAVTVQAALVLPIFLLAIRRLLGVSVTALLAPYVAPTGAACAMAAAVHGVGLLLAAWSPWPRMAVEVAVGGAVYLVLVRVLAPGHFAEMQDLLGRALPAGLRPRRAG